MKKLTCEMCGSTDIIKQEGVFVCQSCGIKYSVEEAKKMMIEGTVDVSGSTIKIDNSEKFNNLLLLAQRAKLDGDVENALNYYSEISIIAPKNWEAILYTKLFKVMNSTMGKLAVGIQGITKSLDLVFGLIKEQVLESERKSVVKSILMDIHSNIAILDKAVMRSNAYDLISDDYYYTVAELYYTLAEKLISYFKFYEYSYGVCVWGYGPYPYYLGEFEEEFHLIENELQKSREIMLELCEKDGFKMSLF